MLRGFVALLLVGAAQAFFPIHHLLQLRQDTEPQTGDPDRYSSCTTDRGYQQEDADAAAFWLVNNVTGSNGRSLSRGQCIYRHVNSTIVSICNGDGRNRTLTADDAKRGIEQLQNDCSPNGGGFSGIHVVNNLTFAAYGVYGGVNLAGGTVGQTSKKARDHVGFLGGRQVYHDPCASPGFDAQPYYDCYEPPGHTLASDGSCGLPLTPDNQCMAYCEVRRTYFVGPETVVPGNSAQVAAATSELEKGTEITVGGGVSLGIDADIPLSIFTVGLDFEYSMEVTYSTSQDWPGDKSPQAGNNESVYYQWVYFAQYVESCGSVSSQTTTGDNTCEQGDQCDQPPTCTGDVVTTGNVCSLTPWMANGTEPIVTYILRFQDAVGNIMNLSEQNPGYIQLCDSSAQEGGAWACAAAPGTR